ncbi:MAG: hypothetical protein QM296_13545 [Bacillota bacterium]|nr:hypothetical protein [Bacillota bacterium]
MAIAARHFIHFSFCMHVTEAIHDKGDFTNKRQEKVHSHDCLQSKGKGKQIACSGLCSTGEINRKKKRRTTSGRPHRNISPLAL